MNTTLAEFAAMKAKPKQCNVCALPEDFLTTVEENEKLGLPVSRPLVVDWLLAEAGVVISRTKLYEHRKECMGISA